MTQNIFHCALDPPSGASECRFISRDLHFTSSLSVNVYIFGMLHYNGHMVAGFWLL